MLLPSHPTVRNPDEDPARSVHTRQTPPCLSAHSTPVTPAASSPQHDAKEADPPAPAKPCPGPSACSSLQQEHIHRSQKQEDGQPLRPHAAQKPHNRLDPPMKVRQMKLLVRRMKIVVGKPKPHHHRRRLQLPHKVPH